MVAMGRISQGLEEMRESTAQEQAETSRRWMTIEEDLKRSNKRYAIRRSLLNMQDKLQDNGHVA